MVGAVVGPAAAERGAARTLSAARHITYRLDPLGRHSVPLLRRFKNRYRGERCFIIGNGPSLNSMDLSLLRGHYTFGLNRVYLLFDRLGGASSFFVSVNPYVIEQCHEDIRAIPAPKFISWASRQFVPRADDVMYLRSTYGPRFSTNPATRGVWEGATVTYVALQLAYFMGFDEVVLIGVDHRFQTAGRPHELIQSSGDDPNHFDPSYFGKGFRWQLPDLETSELAYRLAKNRFEQDGRRVLDATVGGNLNIFPKVSYETLFKR